MKWWGWGDPNVEFPMADKPKLWPWVERQLGPNGARPTPPISRAELQVPAPRLNAAFCAALAKALPEDRYTADDDERLYRTAGKSYPNLFELRKGIIRRAPDMVVSPRSHEETAQVMELAAEHDICVIAFGGGTNIVGCVDPIANEQRMIVTLDTRAMDRVVSVDKYSMTAVIQAGASGPKLEAQLQEHGVSLGHFPDSFEYSTLGGWLATRSAGMQSDAYGRIEDMAVALKMATPAGTIETRKVPAASSGPDVNELIIGSEGILGVITEATMRVHAAPPVKDYSGFLFRSFGEGVSAIRECIRRGFTPSMVRLQDSSETELAFNMKKPPQGIAGFIQHQVKAYLRRRGYDAPCIMIIGFEGEAPNVRHFKKNAVAILKRFGAFPLGASVGKTWSRDKYNIPYLRDYLMDRGVMCDVAETATTWDNVVNLHEKTVAAVREIFAKERGGYGFIGCHISHTYETGACLYFTYGTSQIEGRELEQYYGYKRRITDVFMQNGASLSHHHAVGYEHMPWMQQEVSPAGLQALHAVKRALDPRGTLNPGKLLPPLSQQAELGEQTTISAA